MRPARTLVAALWGAALLAAPPAGAAELEKCVGPDGKVTYSDRGCAANEQKKKSFASRDTLLKDARVEYYDVDGREIPALKISIVTRGGGHPGYATWLLTYEFEPRRTKDGCGVGALKTKLDLKAILPRWTHPANAAPGVEASWLRFIAAVEVHENGHLQIGRDLEANFKRAAATVKAASCDQVGPELRNLYNKMVTAAQERDREYDQRTNFGIAQGAVFH